MTFDHNWIKMDKDDEIFGFLTFLRQVRLMPADDQKKFLYLQVEKHSQISSHLPNLS